MSAGDEYERSEAGDKMKEKKQERETFLMKLIKGVYKELDLYEQWSDPRHINPFERL